MKIDLSDLPAGTKITIETDGTITLNGNFSVNADIAPKSVGEQMAEVTRTIEALYTPDKISPPKPWAFRCTDDRWEAVTAAGGEICYHHEGYIFFRGWPSREAIARYGMRPVTDAQYENAKFKGFRDKTREQSTTNRFWRLSLGPWAGSDVWQGVLSECGATHGWVYANCIYFTGMEPESAQTRRKIQSVGSDGFDEAMAKGQRVSVAPARPAAPKKHGRWRMYVGDLKKVAREDRVNMSRVISEMGGTGVYLFLDFAYFTAAPSPMQVEAFMLAPVREELFKEAKREAGLHPVGTGQPRSFPCMSYYKRS